MITERSTAETGTCANWYVLRRVFLNVYRLLESIDSTAEGMTDSEADESSGERSRAAVLVRERTRQGRTRT